MSCFSLCEPLISVRLPYRVTLREGGETPINSGIELASRLLSEVPDLYHQLASKVGSYRCGHRELTVYQGLQYVYRYTWNDNPKSNVGTSVLAACKSACGLVTALTS